MPSMSIEQLTVNNYIPPDTNIGRQENYPAIDSSANQIRLGLRVHLPSLSNPDSLRLATSRVSDMIVSCLANRINGAPQQTLEIRLPQMSISGLYGLKLSPQEQTALTDLSSIIASLHKQIADVAGQSGDSGNAELERLRAEKDDQVERFKQVTQAVLLRHGVADDIHTQVGAFFYKTSLGASLGTRTTISGGLTLDPQDLPGAENYSDSSESALNQIAAQKPLRASLALLAAAGGIPSLHQAASPTSNVAQTQGHDPDVNNSGCVDIVDLSLIIAKMNTIVTPETGQLDIATTEIPADGVVNMIDVSRAISHFGQCGYPKETSTTPQPEQPSFPLTSIQMRGKLTDHTFLTSGVNGTKFLVSQRDANQFANANYANKNTLMDNGCTLAAAASIIRLLSYLKSGTVSQITAGDVFNTLRQQSPDSFASDLKIKSDSFKDALSVAGAGTFTASAIAFTPSETPGEVMSERFDRDLVNQVRSVAFDHGGIAAMIAIKNYGAGGSPVGHTVLILDLSWNESTQSANGLLFDPWTGGLYEGSIDGYADDFKTTDGKPLKDVYGAIVAIIPN